MSIEHAKLGHLSISRLLIGGNRSNFGQRQVNPGFLPDPIDIPVVSGGNIDLDKFARIVS